jgi:hypothetical protein
MRRVVLFFAVAAALVAAGPKSYNLKLFQRSTIGGKSLPAGEYKIEIADQKAIIRDGKTDVAEAPVQVQTAESTYKTTSMRLAGGGDAPRVEVIRLGGTKMTLLFSPEGAAADRGGSQ